MAGAGGLELAELVPLLSPTCRHDNIIGLLGVVLDHRQQAQMLVLELAQVCHCVSPCVTVYVAGPRPALLQPCITCAVFSYFPDPYPWVATTSWGTCRSPSPL